MKKETTLVILLITLMAVMITYPITKHEPVPITSAPVIELVPNDGPAIPGEVNI